MIAISQFQYGSYANRNRAQRNVIGISCVVLLHIVLVYGVVNGLGRKVVAVMKGPLETKIIDEIKKRDDLPPPPPPKMAPPPPPFVPPPEVAIQMPMTEASNAIVAVTTTKAPPPPPPAPAQQDHEVSARPLTAPPLVYPPRMLAEQREGYVTVECTVEPDGTTNACEVASVKGGYAFADSALDYVKAARYSPRVLNGTPIKEEHHRFNITFALR